MLATLRVFDHAADAVMPEENYWAEYEARLRARLAQPGAGNLTERPVGWLAGLLARPAIPAAAAVVVILLAVVSVAWFSRQRVNHPRVLVTQLTPTPQPSPAIPILAQTGVQRNEIQKPQVVAVKLRQSRPPRPHRSGMQPAGPAPGVLTATNPLPPEITRPLQTDVSPAVTPASHFERAQLLLRSFRNARAEGKGAMMDLAYEKRQAGKLVYDNILLRREAEAKGYLPVEEALTSLEPLLLDIANLPDKPSRGEVQVIRERIQKQELIATLQIVSSEAERFSLPALLNR